MSLNRFLSCLILLSFSGFAKEAKINNIAEFTQGMQQHAGFYTFYYQLE